MQSCSLHPSDAVQGFGCSQQVFCRAKIVFVYTKTLLAGAMKPLNATSKFENHFAIRPVSFQVQLEADGYFSVQKFSHLQPPQAGRAGTTSQVLNLIFYKSSFKTLVGLLPNPTFSTKLRWLCILSSKGIMTHKRAGTVQLSLFSPKFPLFFLASCRK